MTTAAAQHCRGRRSHPRESLAVVKEAPKVPPKRFRRKPGLGRELLLAAAHDEFCERGYARTTTRGIAERAGVAEPLLFRHFGSKAALFNEVVFGPIRAFVLEWEKFEATVGAESTDEALAKHFVSGMYDLLKDNRGLIVTYLATSVFEPDVLDNIDDLPAFIEVIQVMDRITDKRAKHNKPRGSRSTAKTKTRIHERINMGSVIAAALFDELIFAATPARPTRDQIIDELARIAVASLPSRSS
jgi:AcrR family transcriptional regulator